ncbi:MAG: ABC transporter permease [Elusimicrobia bacterium]|nr:ABC transporter permease [Elusimicrobiota bacterium]
MRTYFLAVYTLWQREVVRFFRQKSRVIGAVAPPLVFWFLIGSGLDSSFHVAPSSGGLDYFRFFFPGTVLLIVLFTSIFSTISIIEDRREGFLQSVLVAPIPRSSLVLGDTLGGTTIAMLQGAAFMLLSPAAGIHFTPYSFALTVLFLFLTSFSLTALGFILAWQLDSVQGFHAIMNLLLMPMWLLSGALFPVEGSPLWLHRMMQVNPLTYGIDGLRHGFYMTGTQHSLRLFPLSDCLAAVCLFGAATFVGALWVSGRR